MSSQKHDAAPLSILPILLLGILSVSAASLFIRLAQTEAPSLVIAFYRLGVADLVLAPIVLTRYKTELFSLTRKQLLILILSGFLLSLHFASWVTSLEYTSIASSVVLVTTVPLWVALASPFILHEKTSKFVFIGMLIALSGGIFVGFSSSMDGIGNLSFLAQISHFFQGRVAFGNILAIIGAWTSAGYLVIGRGVRSHISVVPYAFIVYGAAALFLLIMVGISGQHLTGYSTQTYVWLLGLALIPQLLGHSIFNWSLGYLTAAYVSVALLGEPIGATILGYIFLREFPTNLEIIGGILILIGIYLASRAEQSRS